jgi:signal peptidase I
MPGHQDDVRRPLGPVLAVAVVLAVLGAVVVLAGTYTPVAVYGTSMLPAIQPGDLILVDRTAAPRPGSVVTYDAETRWITHRLMGVDADGAMVLRGDANGWDDPPVAHDRAIGVGRWVLPALGLPVLWAHEGRVAPLAMTAVAALLLAALAVRGLRPRRQLV